MQAPSGVRFVLPPWRRDPGIGREVRTLNERAARVDGVEAISGHVLHGLDEGAAEALLVRAGDLDPQALDRDAVAGVAVAAGSDPAEIVVAAKYRRRGLGNALVQAGLDRQGAVWAYGALPVATSLAQRLDLTRTRELLQLRRTTDAGDQSRLPDHVRIRIFVPGRDEQAFLAVNARAFAWHPEQGRLDLAGLRAEMSQEWFDPAGFFLAVTGEPDAERVLGFHWTKVHPVDPTPGAGPAALSAGSAASPGSGSAESSGDGPAGAGPAASPGVAPFRLPGPVGEIYVLGVDPESPVRGLGTPLTAAGLRYLADRGLHTVMLYVEADNLAALALYRRFGFSTYLSNVVYARHSPPRAAESRIYRRDRSPGPKAHG